jgi:16S rRNA (uracil1498-N3)-methyltransferase
MRCYVNPADWAGNEILLSPDESHHLLHVLRAREGQRVDVFNGEGGTGEAEILSIRKKSVALRVVSRRQTPKPDVGLVLIQALPREQKMDLIVQKATELGVDRIIPVLTEHAVVRLGADQAGDKKARWEKIVLNAAKQSGVAWLPTIETPRPLSDVLATHPPYDLFLVCALHEAARPLKDVLSQTPRKQPLTAAVVVGPEGDFSAAELDAIRAAGAIPVDLGGSVLRTETAALYALSVLRYELGS